MNIFLTFNDFKWQPRIQGTTLYMGLLYDSVRVCLDEAESTFLNAHGTLKFVFEQDEQNDNCTMFMQLTKWQK